MSHRTRWAVAVCATAIATGVMASPAAAIPGLVRTAEPTDDTADGQKRVKAKCPDGTQVVGGGGFVNDHRRKQARLTALQPLHDYGGATDYFEAAAETPYLVAGFAWRLWAYALCAPMSAQDGYELEWRWSDPWDEPSTDKFETVSAPCDDGKVAYGSGAGVFEPDGQSAGRVALQLNRTSGPLDISRAAAREDGDFRQPWYLATVAICAKPRGGIHSEARIDAGTDGDLTCAGAGKIHGPGGGGGLVDDGPGWLRKILPSPDLRSVQVGLTAPLNSNDVVVHSTCAN